MHSYLKNPMMYGNKNSPGRPAALSTRDNSEVVRFPSNTTKSANDIKKEIGLGASRLTIRRVIHASPNIVRQKTMKSPTLTPIHKQARLDFGDVSVLPTLPYLYGMQRGEEYSITLEKGVTLLAGIEAISDPDKRGKRTVMCLLNGQMRQVRVRDLSIASEVPAAEKADPNHKGHVATPFSGAVTPSVAVGDEVSAGDPVATIEAMKMEAAINAPVSGVVIRVVFAGTTGLEGGDLVLVIE